MTIEPINPVAIYTIATTGPYALRDNAGNPWPYGAGAVVATVIGAGAITHLSPESDFSVTPASGLNGNLNLSAGALAAHMGKQLVITRSTVLEQGWQATQGAREAGLAAQLDRIVMVQQEQGEQVRRSLRMAAQIIDPTVLTPGRLVLFGENGFQDGPPQDAVENIIDVAAIATQQAAIATEKAAQSAANQASSAASALNSQTAASAAASSLTNLQAALMTGISAARVEDGDLILTYNAEFITGASMLDGNLIITYGV